MNGIIYVRRSYGLEANDLSIEQQIKRCSVWAEKNGVEIKGVFADNNTSSELYPSSEKGIKACNEDQGWQRWLKRERIFKNRKPYRKGLADAFDMIEMQHIDYFIVDEITRFYRNPWATAQLDIFCIEHLVQHGTALVTVADGKIDKLESSVDIAIRRALQAFESETLMQKAENSKKNRKANIIRGIIFSNGYGIEWINKQIFYNAEKMEVVKYVFDSVIQGKTYSEILYTLNTVYKHLADGKCFYETSVYNIIKNSVYSGFKLLEDGRYINILNLANQAPIAFTAYKKANEIVKAKKESSGRQKYHVKDQEKRNFLPFSGLLKCGNCGSRLVCGKDKGKIYYHCKGAVIEKKKSCSPSRIIFDWDKENLDINSSDFHIVFQSLFLIKLYQNIFEMENLSSINAEVENLSADIENIKSKIKTITETFLNSGLDQEVFKKSIDKAKKDLVEKENKLMELKAISSDSSEKELAELRRLKYLIENAESEIDHDVYSRLLRETIKEIIIYKDYIKVVLTDDNFFELPRQQVNKRLKKLPFGKSETFIVDGKINHVIIYNYDKKGKIKTLLKTADYEIRIID